MKRIKTIHKLVHSQDGLDKLDEEIKEFCRKHTVTDIVSNPSISKSNYMCQAIVSVVITYDG